MKSLGYTNVDISSLDGKVVFPQIKILILERITLNLPDVQISLEVKKRMETCVGRSHIRPATLSF